MLEKYNYNIKSITSEILVLRSKLEWKCLLFFFSSYWIHYRCRAYPVRNIGKSETLKINTYELKFQRYSSREYKSYLLHWRACWGLLQSSEIIFYHSSVLNELIMVFFRDKTEVAGSRGRELYNFIIIPSKIWYVCPIRCISNEKH